ncbi:MAG: IclR family transcriptional regulator [Nocardioides sp.]|uniref:IclR family transcriptional regulator n=1 Tax=Nocardioides sp. TaxID=35761 RepID=UPI0039E4A713
MVVAEGNRLGTLTNGLLVLERLLTRPMSVRELSEETGLARQTAYRIVATMMAARWVQREGEHYRTSPRIWSLAAQSFSFVGLRDAHAETLRQLAQTYGESVHLAVYDSGSVVYIDKADGSHPVGSYTTLGGRAPAYCVATGKLLLAFAEANVVDEVIAAGLERHSPLTVTEPAALRFELAQVHRDGYAVNRGEWRLGVAGVAVPVRSPFNEVVAAIGFSGPSNRVLSRLDELVAALRGAVGLAA